MRAICVDDEPMTLEYTVEQCRGLNEIDEARGFARALDALAWSKEHPVDIALLDIDMPDMDGITLAVNLKQLRPDTAVVFLTAYKQFAYDAFAAHPSGYLLKPVMLEELEREVAHALSGRAGRAHARILARTFGTFELLVDGETVAFARSKSKELLAYLIDRRGEGVRRADAFAALWGDRQYDYSMQKQLDVYIRSLRDTLRSHGIEEIFELKRGAMRVFPEKFECDMYRLLAGDAQAVNDYHGEYLRSYGWASVTEALLSEKQRRR
jgi:two-component SAPR family response regulator